MYVSGKDFKDLLRSYKINVRDFASVVGMSRMSVYDRINKNKVPDNWVMIAKRMYDNFVESNSKKVGLFKRLFG